MIFKKINHLKLITVSIFIFSLNSISATIFIQERIEDSIQKYIYNDPLKAKKYAFTFLKINESTNNNTNNTNANKV